MIPDYSLGETLDFKFTTRAFATGVPTVLAGTPVIDVYEDNSITQITTGETLTVDFDSVVGLNNLRIVATSGNGYEAGKSYAAVITTGTVGGVSVVGEVVAQFSIERSPVNWANVTAPTTAVDLSGTDIQLVDTCTTNTDMVSAAPTAAAVADAVLDEDMTAHQTTGTLGQAIGDPVANTKTLYAALITDAAGASVTADVATKATPSQVNTEVVDVINTDTSGEPAQGAPAASASLRTKIDWLYKTLRNKKEETATEWRLYNDAGTVVDSKATVSDASGVATKEEIVSGP